MNRIWIALAAAATLLIGSPLVGAATTHDAKPLATAKKKLVNLNAASAKELKTLPGGSEEEAARIIAGRPYNSKANLVTNKIVSEGRYFEIKSLVVAGETSKPASAASAARMK